MTTKTFRYEAVDAVDQPAAVDVKTAHAAAKALGVQRLIPTSVTATGQGLQRELSLPGFRGRTTLKDLAVFTRQFASMTASGLTLVRALAILEEQTAKPKPCRFGPFVTAGALLALFAGAHVADTYVRLVLPA